MLVPDSLYAKKVEQKIPDHVLLWSVKGQACTVYLLGSVHMLSRGSYPLDARIEKAYASCGRAVFEADMDEAGTEKVQKAMLKQGTYPKGRTIRKDLSAGTYFALQERCKALGIDPARSEQVRPWLVSVMLAAVNLRQLGYAPQDGMDAYFLRKARMDGKETVFLETAGQQIELLSRAMSDRQEDLLKQTLAEMDVVRQSSADLEKAWRRGDAGRVEQITGTSLKDHPEVRKKLFTERNAAWMSQIEKFLSRKEDTFIIVGAGHLAGRDGLLDLLKKKGFEPEQL